ncbi:MAG TPA: exonuclease domain-containing protein [Burkholderiaceae bacterium]|nr:exonuclease domain-containing protein [Burkholderiaceae bacterium]
MFAPRVCFVDVETTGSSPARERVTEVGVVSVEADGDDLRVSEWSSLVNPGVPIPGEIQWLTGITNEMVRCAPRFAEIAPDLAARLHDAIFVAHNVRFDYGFLRSEFARCGLAWRAPTLCTVRLSRLLYPERAPHSLDALIDRFGIEGEVRHRALGDARVLWRFMQRLVAIHGRNEVESTVERLLARPATPAFLPPEALDEVPPVPGVYLFFGLNEYPIYIGKSVDLRARVCGHFNADYANATDARLAQEVRRIEWEETAGAIGALLREAELVKTRLPAHNIALRRRAQSVLVEFDQLGRPHVFRAAEVSPEGLSGMFGPFGSRASARRRLTDVASQHTLCMRALGLERRGRRDAGDAPCFNFQLHRCRGCCVGAESAADHAVRVAEAVEPLRIPAWPYRGAVALVETNRDRQREDWHVFDRWCWLGSVRTLDAALALAKRGERAFEVDAYRIARQAVARAGEGLLAVEPLP